MPSTWTSFLRSNSGGSNGTTNRSANSTTPSGAARDRPLPALPDEPSERLPTLLGRDGERAGFPPPVYPRPHTAGGERHHRHNRSASQPLPRFFGRKKSTGNLTSHYDADGAHDRGFVPVLDGPQTATPTRVISGRKGRVVEDEESKSQRKCMCCSSKVKVPKDLDKFRCLACLCINDLIPMEEQRPSRDGEDEAKSKGRSRAAFAEGILSEGKHARLSTERTAAIIERCVIAYLEGRCRPEEDRLVVQKNPETPVHTPDERDNPFGALPSRPRSAKDSAATPRQNLLPTASPLELPTLHRAASPAAANRRDLPPLKSSTPILNGSPPRDSRPTPHGPGPPSYLLRKPVPTMPMRKVPPPPLGINTRSPSQTLRPNGVASKGDSATRPPLSPRLNPQDLEQRRHYDRVKVIFRALEDYIVDAFGEFQSLNASFSTIRPSHTARAHSDSNIATPPPENDTEAALGSPGLPQLDAKMLLLGDIGENSTWWTGKLKANESDKVSRRKKVGEHTHRIVSSKSPNINWNELSAWYEMVHSAGLDWRSKLNKVKVDGSGASRARLEGQAHSAEIDSDLAQARDHAIRALLKVTENLLKRPGRLLSEPDDLRWLLLILANPSLYPSKTRQRRTASGASAQHAYLPRKPSGMHHHDIASSTSPKKAALRDESQPHSGVLKRAFGLLASSNETCHRYLIGWLARFDDDHFTRLVDLIASFVTHRIARRSSRPRSRGMAADGGLIPDLSGSAMNTSAQLHSAMGLSGSVKKRPENLNDEPEYANDWQTKAAARLMSLLFAANNIWQGKRRDDGLRSDSAVTIGSGVKARRCDQLLHTSSFYNTLLDYGDILADFKVWESKPDRFAFCQYPFFLSMGSKIKILEYDAHRQMEIKAREAYFDSVIRQRALDGYFHLRVRRDCMVGDSLQQISEAVGGGPEELKKGLRVHFTGEEGVDAGGLRKEWFLLLVRDIFDPNYGLFVYDEDSRTCYFNPNSFETSDQYYLVGALLGLAIYNSTILDIALPPFAFRKLLAAAPAAIPGTTATVSSLTGIKGQMTYTLSDLAEFRPSLAHGLRQLLDFDGDVQETYCWNFVAPVERYGTVVDVPLRPSGERQAVTNTNRHEFVDAYVRYLLDTAVHRQFEPFKRGFFQVCAGNALSLFRAEEIELLVRGSDEALDVSSLRAVAVYENWRSSIAPYTPISNPADSVPVIAWFWNLFAAAPPLRQRRLLTFVTGTDRIPAVGATSLVLRIVGGGDGFGGGGALERERFPVARTCFNQLVLWHYASREALAEKLWRAVEESEGFGLK